MDAALAFSGPSDLPVRTGDTREAVVLRELILSNEGVIVLIFDPHHRIGTETIDVQATAVATEAPEAEARRRRPDAVHLPTADVVIHETIETIVGDPDPPLVAMNDDVRGRLWAVVGAVEARRRMATWTRPMLSALMMRSMTMSEVKPAATSETSSR